MQTKQEENLAALKKQLGRLVFVQVGKVVAKESDILCFTNKGGITTWGNEPTFRSDMDELKYADEWDKAEKSYHNYFGFGVGAQEPGVRNIYFNRKTCVGKNDLTRLNVFSRQDASILPPLNSWIVGILGMQSADSKGPWFQQWQSSTECVKLFVDYFLGREEMVLEDIIKLVPETSDGRDRLVAMATILILQDMDFVLNVRKTQNTTAADCAVFDVCDMYDQAFWLEYKQKALEQRVYSELIREPAPKKITEQLDARPEDTVGLNTPFAKLVLR